MSQDFRTEATSKINLATRRLKAEHQRSPVADVARLPTFHAAPGRSELLRVPLRGAYSSGSLPLHRRISVLCPLCLFLANPGGSQPSTKHQAPSTLRSPLSALRSPLSALRSPLSALRSPLSAPSTKNYSSTFTRRSNFARLSPTVLVGRGLIRRPSPERSPADATPLEAGAAE
jgi:hypothetical protein